MIREYTVNPHFLTRENHNRMRDQQELDDTINSHLQVVSQRQELIHNAVPHKLDQHEDASGS